jgi:phage shock protein E
MIPTLPALLLLCSLSLLSFAPPLAAADHKSTNKASSPATFKNIAVEEFDKLRQDKSHILLDVRTPGEFKDSHIPGAILIDFNAPDFDQQIAKLDKNRSYLVYCAVGGRSAKACKKMEKLNFSTLYNLEGGIKAWEKQGKPVLKK